MSLLKAVPRCASVVCRRVHSDNAGPLAGIRVLDMSRIVAGPYATMLLGDLGADIIKLERPGRGDECRHWGPPFLPSGESTYFLAVNRNKRSVCIDFATAEGRELTLALAAESDVLVENFVPGKLDALGLGYEEVRRANPRLIYCSVTGYGPDSKRPGYDVVAASEFGLLSVTGPEDGEPCKEAPTLRLCLRKPQPKKSVQWGQGTIDNEHMNKKKSKCCCQFEKARAFDESSSEDDDDDCDNCSGHADKKKPAADASEQPPAEDPAEAGP